MGKTKKAETVEKDGKAPKKKPDAVKHGTKPSMVRYKNEMRWLTNKERKLKKHLRSHPNDLQAERALV